VRVRVTIIGILDLVKGPHRMQLFKPYSFYFHSMISFSVVVLIMCRIQTITDGVICYLP
jgi:hypothetical protein